MIADRIKGVQSSATLALKAKANELKQHGKEVIDLTAGEPDFPTPAAIKEAGVAAINADFTRYTAVDGISPLRQAICSKLEHDNSLCYSSDQIIVSSGAKHCLYNILQTIINPGDEVIIGAPYWVSYPEMVKLASGDPKVIELTPDNLAKRLTKRTKALILNTPNNPTGAVYSKAELQALAEVLLAQPQLTIISDEIYEHICWHPDGFNNILNVCPELAARTIIVNGVSKAYAMTGWRIGYAAGPKELIQALKRLQSHSTSCPNSIAQKAALEALLGSQDEVGKMVTEFKARHDFCYQALSKMADISVAPGYGAFYLFPEVSRLMAKLNCATDQEFAAKLLEETGIAVVPGSAFGAPGHVRISYVAAIPVLETALTRLATQIYM